MDKKKWNKVINNLIEECPYEDEKKKVIKEMLTQVYKLKSNSQQISDWPETKELKTNIRILDDAILDTTIGIALFCLDEQPYSYLKVKNGEVTLVNKNPNNIMDSIIELFKP